MTTPLVHRRDLGNRSPELALWERQRNRKPVHFVMELLAEAMGVFFYVYAGVGATAPFIIGGILKLDGLGSLFQIGWGYACGIVLALGVCGATSGGGHINPCITICFALFKGFPRKKVIPYILAQIFGAYIASLLIYHQWEVFILEAEAALKKAGVYESLVFTPNGTAGIFALYLPPGQTYARVFLNEFMNSVFVALVIWASLDPTNALYPPVMGPFVIALAYAAAIWGFAVPAIALNSARDVGARFAAMTIWGVGAAGGRYAAISALTNIPATIFAYYLYETIFVDSDRVIPAAQLEYARIVMNHQRFGSAHHHGDSAIRDRNEAETASSRKLSVIEYENTRV
ncbi:hypothetical protein AMATHDRAFT_138659 [Amanita thiersii Skay4041]|uniref:Aquaporin n=1 Tax=Amanita thiersii Skay4041 TaxID=703135 RepID=A0A2A9NX72_9AGAR|nr:hypothetical protein AMATHDRAFT_138659 [Amanita thiersii Skay4041]